MTIPEFEFKFKIALECYKQKWGCEPACVSVDNKTYQDLISYKHTINYKL